MEDTNKQQTKMTIEMCEISEQLVPLMPAKLSSVVLLEYDNDSNDTCVPTTSRGATATDPPLTPLIYSEAEANDDHSASSQEKARISGGIPKSRRRPGSTRDSQCVTMTGTVKTGNSVGQPVEVQIELTENEFLRLTSREPESKGDHKYQCGRAQGPHIILWSLLCIPMALVISACVSFYNGAVMWYNVVTYFSEEKSFIHKLTVCPLVILSFPVTVGLSAVGVAVTAAVMQVSWSWHWWWAEICDGEKGFYGWACNKLQIPACSPYQVVVLNESSA
ncbi:unnamed protein product [Candidula unifasciata]|uniref:Transmembrane protein 169 n=1 Tax=Candidula unifasciata TaxID=100452 RepID=A0A8S3Z4H1_9EUPU|nr:unnamed protein product [Candidula unifasciata]